MLELDRSAGLPLASDQLALITDAIPVLVSYIDTEMRYRYNNRAYEEWFGHSREEIRGRTLRDVLGDAAYAAIEPNARKALAGERVTYEALVPYRDGGERFIHAAYIPDRADDGVVRGFVALVSDISERHLAEVQRDALASLSRELTAGAFDPESMVRSVVRRCVEVVGDAATLSILANDGLRVDVRAVQHRDPTAREMLARLLIDDPPTIEGPVGLALKDGQPVFMPVVDQDEYRRLNDPAHYAYLDAYGVTSLIMVPLRVEGRGIGVLAAARGHGRPPYNEQDFAFMLELADAAALALHRARLHEAVEHRAAQLQSLTDALPSLLVVTTPQGEIDSANPAYLAYTGLSIEEAREWQQHQMIHPDDLAGAMERWTHALSTGEMLTSPMRLRRHDGQYRWHQVNGMPVRREGRIVSWVTISTDIHERVQAEAEREQLVMELRRANAAKDEFLGLISHELKTPITTIFGNAEILRTRYHALDDEHRTAALSDVSAEAERLHRIIDNLLVLARLEQPGQSVQSEPLIVRRVVARVVEEFQKKTPGRPISIEYDGEVAPVMAQATYIDQIIRNLLSNAEKYSPPGAPIDVRVSRTDTSVLVSVMDQGQGVDEEEAEKLFTPFYRSHRTARTASGVGIGLAVCKRLVEVMGGQMWARSRPGGGADIGFSLPISPPDEDG